MHILLINPNNDCFTNPVLVKIIEEVERDKSLSLTLALTRQSMSAPDKFKQVRQIYMKDINVNWPKKIWKWGPILLNLIFLVGYCKKNMVSKILGVDPVGFILAARIKSFLRKIEVHYLSFEIFFLTEVMNNKPFFKIKKKEIKYGKYLDVLVIQDKVRKELLINENKWNNRPIECVFCPVAPSLFSTDPYARKLYRDKLGINENECVIVHSGSVDKWSGGELLPKILAVGLPPNFRLLVHSKYKFNPENKAHKQLLQLASTGYPLILHDQYFADYEDYLNFLQVADVGLALYEADFTTPYTGKNIDEVGLSSGKFSTYMLLGIPTIATPNASFIRLNKIYKFGTILYDVREIGKHLQDLTVNMPVKNCKELYMAELNPEKQIFKYVRLLTRKKI